MFLVTEEKNLDDLMGIWRLRPIRTQVAHKAAFNSEEDGAWGITQDTKSQAKPTPVVFDDTT